MASNNFNNTGLSDSELDFVDLLEQISKKINRLSTQKESTVFLMNKLAPNTDFPYDEDINELVQSIKYLLRDNSFDPVIISLEDIKQNITSNVEDSLALFKNDLNANINAHNDIIIADTNCTIKERKQIIDMIDNPDDCYIACVLVNKPVEAYRKEYKDDEYTLDEIEFNYNYFQTPFFEEGFNNIFVLNYPDGIEAERFKTNRYIKSTYTTNDFGLIKDYNHRVKENLSQKTKNNILLEAARASALGSGKSNHEAYDFLSCEGIFNTLSTYPVLDVESTLECAFYINYQDIEKQMEKEELKNFRTKAGKRRYDNLILLNQSLKTSEKDNIINNEEIKNEECK